MILPPEASLALILLAFAVMLGGNLIWKNDRDSRLISQAGGLVILVVGQLSSSLRSFEQTRLRLSDAVAILSQSSIADQTRVEAAGSASRNLADLREDALFLGFGWVLVGFAVAYLVSMIFKPAPSSDATQPGTPA